MPRGPTPQISMDRSAHYVTQSSLWGGPQFTRTHKRRGNVYRRPRTTKVDEKAARLRDLILNALMA